MHTELDLDPVQTRVLGALIEKQLSTPDHYPLSLAALTAACNQKSSREPVMAVREVEVRDALDALIAAAMVREQSGYGSRVPKFAHRLGDALGLKFGFQPRDLALLATLMLRGAQTSGELRARTARMHEFGSVAEVEEALHRLQQHERGPWVRVLAREPGRRESRYVQMFSAAGESIEFAQPAPLATTEGAPPPAPPAPGAEHPRDVGVARQVAALERQVEDLRRRLERLERDLGIQAAD